MEPLECLQACIDSGAKLEVKHFKNGTAGELTGVLKLVEADTLFFRTAGAVCALPLDVIRGIRFVDAVPTATRAVMSATDAADEEAAAGSSMQSAAVALREAIVQSFSGEKTLVSSLPYPDFASLLDGIPAIVRPVLEGHVIELEEKYRTATREEEFASLARQTLRPLAQAFPDDPHLHYLKGLLELRANRLGAARDALGRLVVERGNSADWLAFAAVAELTGTLADCTYALHRRFQQSLPREDVAPWALYLRLILRFNAFDELRALYRRSDAGSSNEMLGRGLVYLLFSLGRTEEADLAALRLLRARDASDLVAWRAWAESLPHGSSVGIADAASRLPATRPRNERHGGVGTVVDYNVRDGRIRGVDGNLSFARKDVPDERLRERLDKGEKGMRVAYLEGNTSRRVALMVYSFSTVDELLLRAVFHYKRHEASLALSLINLGIGIAHDEGMPLTRARVETPKTEATDSVGPYARAKRAMTYRRHRDQAAAEELFKEAIATGDRSESAVKDLAMLLNQQGRQREAVQLLVQHRTSAVDKRPFDNLLSDIYQKLGEYEKAVEILTPMDAASPRDVALLRRIAYCNVKLQRRNEAVSALSRILEIHPGDQAAQKWLGMLQTNQPAGRAEDWGDILLQLSEAERSNQLSALARRALEKPRIIGPVSEEQLDTPGAVTKLHIRELLEIARKHTQKDRAGAAGYHLSAAALIRQLDLDDDDHHFDRSMCEYFISLGDQTKDRDVDAAQAYYAEALRFAKILDESFWYAICRYYRCALPDPPHPAGLRDGKIDARRLVDLVHRYVSAPATEGAREERRRAIIKVTLRISAESPLCASWIFDTVREVPIVRATFESFLGTTAEVEDAWKKKRKELATRVADLRSVLERDARTELEEGSLHQLMRDLEALDRDLLKVRERHRLAKLTKLGQRTLAYHKAGDPQERQRQHLEVSHECRAFREDILELPTQISYELLLPVSERLMKIVDDAQSRFVDTNAPDLELTLARDGYFPNEERKILVHFVVRNRVDRIPAQDVRVRVRVVEETLAHAPDEVRICETLRGGEEATDKLEIGLKSGGRMPATIELRVELEYRVGDKAMPTIPTPIVVHLSDGSSWTDIKVPYGSYVGQAMARSDLFVGRAELVERLSEKLRGDPTGLMLVGQPRSGKSSVATHLAHDLRRHGCLVAELSCSDITPLEIGSIIRRIARSLWEALEPEAAWSASAHAAEVAPIAEFVADPAGVLHASMRRLSAKLEGDESRRGRPVVVIIDEASRVFEALHQFPDRMAAFPQLWKSIIDKRYFSSVLVAQLVTPAMKQKFSNAFSAIDTERVAYLEPFATRELVEKMGTERFLPGVVEKIHALTGGNPWYTIRLCSDLMDYMNEQKISPVCKGDVDHIKLERLIKGKQRLDQSSFSCLYQAGSGEVDLGIRAADSFAICEAVAKHGRWCPRESLVGLVPNAEAVIEDLVFRDALEQDGARVRLRVELFRDWLVDRF